MRQFGKRVSWALLAMSMMVGTGYAVILSGYNYVVFLPGVDVNGNPDANLGTFTSGKLYKDSRTGVLWTTASTYVWNASCRPAVFRNISYNINDPWARESHQATSDEIYVGFSGVNGVAGAAYTTAYAVYVP